jgi:hypothetical protein
MILSELPSNLCIHTDIVTLRHAVEKECIKTANYVKGTCDHLHYFMKIYHLNEYQFPFPHACGGKRQDIGLGKTL